MEQLHIFLLCAACGIAGGALYDVFFLLSRAFRHRAVHIAADALFCVAFSGVYLLFSLSFALPSMRLYQFLACALGFFLYLKSFHKIVAFCADSVYNKIRPLLQKIRERLWRRISRGAFRKRKQRRSR